MIPARIWQGTVMTPMVQEAGGAGHPHGSPDALAAPSKNVATGGKIVVAHTPNTPPRFEGLLRTITSLIPCEHKGKSYECSLGQMNAFLRWSQAENAFFFEITSLPKADDASSGLVLTEINTRFFLKLVRDQVNPNSSDLGPRHTQNQIPTELHLCPVILYSIPNGQMGSCLTHCVDFSGETYPILLENGPYVSSLEKLDGFNTSLAEIVVKEPLLKIKHIIGSTTDKMHCFARQRCKSILQSLFAELAMLFESGKCISCPADIRMHHVLVRANKIKLYALPVTYYVEELAEENVISLVGMVKSCFPQGEIPTDLYGLLEDLEKDPLNEIRTAKEDCSLLKAEDRRSLLININSEYMTNVPAKSDDDSDGKIDEFSFFYGCPDAKDWDLIMKDNEYLVQICNVEKSSDEDKKRVQNANASERMKKKGKLVKTP
ncbi:hypothetical protein ACQ4PT_036724 [Festuca glaucescens]